MTTATYSAHQVASDAFGTLKDCKNVIQQLESLLIALKESAPEGSNQARLASLGAYVAMDHANAVDCLIEDYERLLTEASAECLEAGQ